MVRPWRVVRGLGATPKRRSAASLMARRPELKSEVQSLTSEVGADRRFKVRDSGFGFEGGAFCVTVSALCIIMGNGTPPFAAWEMDESRISMKKSSAGNRRQPPRGQNSLGMRPLIMIFVGSL